MAKKVHYRIDPESLGLRDKDDPVRRNEAESFEGFIILRKALVRIIGITASGIVRATIKLPVFAVSKN